MASAVLVKREDVSWQAAHEELVRLAAARAGLDFEEGRGLLRAQRARVHQRFGFAAFYEYTERLFGYGPRLTQEKLRVAEALEELPETARDLQTAAISFSHARELTRVATPSTEKAWLEAARGRTVREVEKLVSGHRPGNVPDDVPDDDLKRHVLRLELSGEAMATFREAMGKMRRDAGESLDDDAAIRLLCRQALGSPKDSGRSNYQIALTVCERCRRATQQGRGEAFEVGPEVVAKAECDGQHIGHVDAHVYAEDSASTVGDVDARACAQSGTGTVGDVDAQEAPSTLGGVRKTLARATQSIPPAIRRAVIRRDGGKCRVPGCRHSVFTEPHHIVPRSEGGKHTTQNIVTLCDAHHGANHQGRLIITGSADSVLHFTHADGTPYGGPVAPTLTDARAKAFQALVGLGFREGQAKGALARVPEPVSDLKRLINRALRELTPR